MKKHKNKKLNYLKAFILGAVLLGIIAYLIAHSPLSAADFLNLPDPEYFGDVPSLEGETGVAKAQDFVTRLMRILRIAMAAIGIGLMVLYGLIMVLSGHNEETVTKQRKGFLWGIIGLALISVAGSLSVVFDFQGGSFLGDEQTIFERAGIFDDRVATVITFLKYFLGSVAVFMIVESAFKMITAGDKEETITNERKQIIGGVIGIVIIVIAEFFVRRVLFKVDESINYNEAIIIIDTKAGVDEIIAVTNFMVSFVGPVMVLGIVAGGLMYALSGGDEEKATKAKKILINSVIGAFIVYGAFAIVSTMVTGII